MEIFIRFLRVFIWWLLFDMAASAGTLKSPFLLIFTWGAMTYWYWRHPVFKNQEEKQED